MLKKSSLTVASLMLALSPAMAGGYMVGEQSTASMGMGSAVTALSQDASTAWFNPAGAAFQEQAQLTLGALVLAVPSVQFRSNALNPKHPSSASSAAETFVIPHVYYSRMFADSPWGMTLSVNAPFGLRSSWPAQGPFASKNTLTQLKLAMINPSMVYRINKHWAVSVGIDYADVLKVSLDNSLQSIESGKGSGWGGNASLQYQGEQWNFGVNYRSRMKLSLQGRAVARSALAAPPFNAISSPASTSITLPDQLNIGVAWHASDRLLLSMDVDWVNWGVFDQLNIQYSNAAYRGAVGGLQVAAAGGTPTQIGQAIAAQAGKTTIVQQWKSTIALRFGGQWEMTQASRVRAAYVYDPSPASAVHYSPISAGTNEQIFSLGYGYDLSKTMVVDLAYAYAYFGQHQQVASVGSAAVFNGSYAASAQIFSASLSYKF